MPIYYNIFVSQERQIKEVREPIGWFACFPQPLDVHVDIPQRGVAVNDTIKINAEIRNKTFRPIKSTQLQLIQVRRTKLTLVTVIRK